MQLDIFKEIDSLQREIDSYRPLSPDLLKQIKEYYRVGLTFSSNALEGNTLTESETTIVLEEGVTIGPCVNAENRPRRLCLQALIAFSESMTALASETIHPTAKGSINPCGER